MKSDNDLQNSDNCVVLKTVSPQILDKGKWIDCLYVL